MAKSCARGHRTMRTFPSEETKNTRETFKFISFAPLFAATVAITTLFCLGRVLFGYLHFLIGVKISLRAVVNQRITQEDRSKLFVSTLPFYSKVTVSLCEMGFFFTSDIEKVVE